MSIFEHATADGRWLRGEVDGTLFCVAHLAEDCRTCEPPAPARVGGGLVGAAEQSRIAPGRILSVGIGEPIASRMLSADGTWVFDLATGNRACVGHLRRVCHDCGPYPAGELVAAAGSWAKLDVDAWTEDDAWEPPAGHIPTVDSAEQLTAAIGYAQAHPHARWYIGKRARALGFAAAVPRSWADTEPVAAAAADTEEPEQVRAVLRRRVRPLTEREKLYRRVHGRLRQPSDGGR